MTDKVSPEGKGGGRGDDPDLKDVCYLRLRDLG